MKDSVCGMEVKDKSVSANHNGSTYYFCNKRCKEQFEKEPDKYLKKSWVKKYRPTIMIIACILPLVIVLLAVTFLGISRSYLFWTALLICPITHYFFMKDMHKGGGCH